MQKLIFKIRPLTEALDASDLLGQGSLVNQIYGLLRKRIINLSLPPELALVEQEVASVLKVSKTPVREAIIRLSREGLVKVVPKSGSYVTAVSLDRYLDAFFVRSHLEVGCIKRLAKRGVNMAEQVKLKAFLTLQREALQQDDDSRFFELDEDLHWCFFELAGLTGVWKIMNLAKGEMDRVRHLKRQFGIRRSKLVVEEHTAIVNAVIDRDPVKAERAMLDNIGAPEDEMDLIAENPQLLRTIEDLNTLVALDRKTHGRKKAAKA